MYWCPGEVVAWRQTWQRCEYLAIPVRVVEDTEELLVVYWAESTRYVFGPCAWPFADTHPWAEQGAWHGHGVLALMKPGAGYSIWHLWKGKKRRFAGWYVNLQEPFRRDDRSYFTQDQELDIRIEPDGTWRWKDEQELEDWVARGRFTRREVTEIRRVGQQVVAEWPFPTGWEGWEPDPAWRTPTLPLA